MGKWSDALAQQDPSSAPAPPPEAPAGGKWSQMLGDGSSLTQGKDTPGGFAGRPTVVDDAKYALPNLTNVRASLAIDPKTQIKRYAHSTGIPEDRFGIVNGEIVYVPPGENFYAKAVPTIGEGRGVLDTADRVLSQTSAGFGPAIPGIAGTVAGTIAGPTGASIPIAGATAAGADLARTTLDKALAGESLVPSGGDVANALGHGVINMAGQAVGAGANRLITRNPLGVESFDRVSAMNPTKQAERAALQTEAKARGVYLSTGQSTGLRSVMATERQLGRYPETADQVHDFTANQREVQVPRAVRAELDKLAKPRPSEEAIAAFRKSAAAIPEAYDAARTAAVSPHYEAAFNSGATPDVIPIIEMIDRKLPNTAGVAKKALESIRSMLVEPAEGTAVSAPGAASVANPAARARTPAVINAPGSNAGTATEIPVDNYRALHSAKMNIDNVLGKLVENEADANAIKEATTAVTPVKQALQTLLEDAHPGYKEGATLYRQLSPAVEAIKTGAIGKITAQTDPIQRINSVQSILDASNNIPPSAIARARGEFKQAGFLDEWNAATRAYIENKLDTALKSVVTGGEPGNVPGKVYAGLWGDPKQKAVVTAALGDRALVDSMDNLMNVLRASSRVLPEGAATATDLGQGVSKSIGARVVAKAFSPLSYANAGNELLEIGTALRTPGARIKLADYLLSDKGAEELRNFRMLPPAVQRSGTAIIDLMTNAGVIAGLNAVGARKPGDFDAPVLKQQGQR